MSSGVDSGTNFMDDLDDILIDEFGSISDVFESANDVGPETASGGMEDKDFKIDPDGTVTVKNPNNDYQKRGKMVPDKVSVILLDRAVKRGDTSITQLFSRNNYSYVANKAKSGFGGGLQCTYIYPEGHKRVGAICTANAIASSDPPLCRWHISPEKYVAIKGTTMMSALADRSAATMMEGGRGFCLPKDLVKKYEIILADPKLIALRTDIAFIEARIQVLTARLTNDKTSAPLTKLILDYTKRTRKDVAAGVAMPIQALQSIEIMIQSEYDRDLIWGEVYMLTEQKRKLVETESKRLKDLNAYFTPEQAMALVYSISRMLKKYVPTELLVACQDELATVLRMSKGDYSTPIDEVGKELANYSKNIDVIDATQDGDGVFATN